MFGLSEAAVKPQTLACLELLRARPEGITALTALNEANCFRLAARVGELKEAGYAVRSELFTTATGKRIARYRLDEREQLAMALA